MKNLKKINNSYNKKDEIDWITTILKKQRIKIFKYNNSLSENDSFYDATLQLSEDEK